MPSQNSQPFVTGKSPANKTLVCPEKPWELHKDNFLSTDEVSSMVDLLGYLKDGGDFVKERGHSVKLYGQPYAYTGSRSSDPDPIPPELEAIINKLTDELALNERPNSVLINHYPATAPNSLTESHLAMHSDDEPSIIADSKIITLSIGASRTRAFEPKYNKNEQPVELELNHNSIYAMSRSSQNWYRHGIPPPPGNADVDDRFSITFRCLNKKFSRSILLIGDSNTKEVMFGSGTGKVGESYPGSRTKASMVKDIDPHKCVGYSNVFIMCGTNDLRSENIKSELDIYLVVEELKNKLGEIKQLCPKAKLFVVPVLPSRIPRMNENITRYNDLVDNMLSECFPGIWFKGMYGFLDHQNLLSVKLARANDNIHLGSKGIAKLVTLIKICVFKREKQDSSMLAHPATQESTQMVGSPDPT